MPEQQIVILAGGLGTRLRPLTEKCPKPMVPVAGKPFLFWQIEDLKAQGFKKILLLVAYLGEQVEAHFGDGREFGVQISYSFEPEPLGTGGALRHAFEKLEAEFILLNGDSFLKAPLTEMLTSFHAGGCDAMVSVYNNRIAVPVIPNIQTAAGKVVAYRKDAGLASGFDKIDSGIYIVKRSLLEKKAEPRFQLADLWPPLIAQGRLGAFSVDERFYDIGTPERLKEFEEKVCDYFPHSTAH